MRRVLSVAVLAVAMGASWGLTVLNAADAPKYTIKEVMDKAHKQKLLNKVVDGSATKDEKQLLVDLYVAMGQATAPKGDADSWKSLNDALIAAAKDAAADKEGAGPALKKASACGGCHSKHK